MKTVALRSLGCKVNAYETEGMQQILSQNGYFIVPFDTCADIYIVNTCSVTNIADHKSRQMLHRAKHLNPKAVVVACGCYVQTGYETLAADPAIDIIVGNNEKKNIAQILEEYFEQNTAESSSKISHVPDMMSDLEYEEMHIGAYSDKTRGFVKIQDGCNRFCTYCVIPYARGRVRSRLREDVIKEVCGMAGDGCKEVVLTGIHVSSYGTDRGESELLTLLKELQAIEGIERIRLSSLEPGIITEEFAEGIGNLSKVCPHFHLSMQSGSLGVLKRMNRHYTPDEFYDKVSLLRKIYDKPAITTDVIVGFPGETEGEFEETRTFIERVGFFELHVFKYSRRDGTKAAVMPGQIPEREKARRSDELISLGNRLSLEYMNAHKGKKVRLLTEETKTIEGETYLLGHIPEYICAGIKDPEGKYSENTMVTGTLGEAVNGEVMQFIPDDI